MGETYCGNSSYVWIQGYLSTILWSPRHWIWVTINKNWCSWNHIKIEKNIKRSMGKLYPSFSRRDKNIVAILHIYWVQAIFLLFCDHQDTEFESQVMVSGVAGPIFTHKIYKRIYVTIISILYKMGK